MHHVTGMLDSSGMATACPEQHQLVSACAQQHSAYEANDAVMGATALFNICGPKSDGVAASLHQIWSLILIVMEALTAAAAAAI